MRAAVVVAGVVTTLVATSSVYAQAPASKFCVLGGAPEMLDDTTAPAYRAADPDSGVWPGSTSQPFETGSATAALEFRSVWENAQQPMLHLRWKVDSSTFAGQDLFVGFNNTTSKYVIRFHVDAAITAGTTAGFAECTTATCTGNYLRVYMESGTGTTCGGPRYVPVDIQDPTASNPSWLRKGALVRATSDGYVITMSAPVLAASTITDWLFEGLPRISGALPQFWYQVDVPLPGSPAPGVVTYSWPPTGDICKQSSGQGEQLVRVLGVWGTINLEPADAVTTSCTGLWIDWSRIGTLEPTASGPPLIGSKIIADGSTSNQFVAHVHNDSGRQVELSELESNFYLYKWGSQPMTPTSAGHIGMAKNTTTIPVGGDGQVIFPMSFATDAFDQPSQCMMVKLNSPFGLGFDAARTLAFRNMIVVPNSIYQDLAEISVKGLTALAGASGRDVFLVVSTQQMPPELKVGPTVAALIKQRAEARRRRLAEARERIGHASPLTERLIQELASADGIPADASYQQIVDWTRYKHPLSLAMVLPTFQVYAFHDTGQTRISDAGKLPVLAPQSSFGYFSYHEGPAAGWAWALDGAEQLGPNVFRIRVPNDGSAPVQVRLQTLEQPGEIRVVSRPFWPFASEEARDQWVAAQCDDDCVPPCPKCPPANKTGCCSSSGAPLPGASVVLLAMLVIGLGWRRRRQ